MKEFMFVFRVDFEAMPKDSPEEMQAEAKKWQDWLGGIAAQNKFETGRRLSFDGKVVRANGVITDGPYAEIKESIGGYMFVKVEALEDAVELAKGCPILLVGGNVEIRELDVV